MQQPLLPRLRSGLRDGGGAFAISSIVARLHHFVSVFSRLNAASDDCDRCIAARTACVVVAPPQHIWRVMLPSISTKGSHLRTVKSNVSSPYRRSTCFFIDPDSDPVTVEDLKVRCSITSCSNRRARDRALPRMSRRRAKGVSVYARRALSIARSPFYQEGNAGPIIIQL